MCLCKVFHLIQPSKRGGVEPSRGSVGYTHARADLVHDVPHNEKDLIQSRPMLFCHSIIEMATIDAE